MGCGDHIGHVNYTVGTYPISVPSAPGGSKWDLVTIGPVAFEEMFETVIL